MLNYNHILWLKEILDFLENKTPNFSFSFLLSSTSFQGTSLFHVVNEFSGEPSSLSSAPGLDWKVESRVLDPGPESE